MLAARTEARQLASGTQQHSTGGARGGDESARPTPTHTRHTAIAGLGFTWRHARRLSIELQCVSL